MPGHKNKVDIKDFATTTADQLAANLVLKKKEKLQPIKPIKELSNDTPYSKPTQLGNVTEDNTIASLVYSGPVIKQGFNLAKKAPNIIRRVINKGKDFASTRMGRLAMKHADDVFNVVSSSGGLSK